MIDIQPTEHDHHDDHDEQCKHKHHEAGHVHDEHCDHKGIESIFKTLLSSINIVSSTAVKCYFIMCTLLYYVAIEHDEAHDHHHHKGTELESTYKGT